MEGGSGVERKEVNGEGKGKQGESDIKRLETEGRDGRKVGGTGIGYFVNEEEVKWGRKE